MKRSKKKTDGLNIKFIAGIAAFLFGLAFCSMIESTYTRNAIVTDISSKLVSCIDESGKPWQFWGNDFYIGESIKLVMDTNHTDSNIYDDTVKKVLTK